MKKVISAIFITCLFSACSQSEKTWEPVKCNEKLDHELEDIEEEMKDLEKFRDEYEEAQRAGDPHNKAENLLKRIQGIKESNLASNIGYIDSEIFRRCKQSDFSQEKLDKVEKTRKLMGEEEQEFEAEGMSDIRVTEVRTEFVPYEELPNGSCRGPLMDIFVTVQNYGEDFPRKVDLETLETLIDEGKRKKPLDETIYVTVSCEADFGKRKQPCGLEQKLRSDFPNGVFKSGASFTLSNRLQVYDNEKTLEVTASAGPVVNALRTGNKGQKDPYIESVNIPIWDITPAYSKTLRDRADDDKPAATISVFVENLGPTPTPGPLYGNVNLHNDENERPIAGWSVQTLSSLDQLPKDFESKSEYQQQQMRREGQLLGDKKKLDEELSDSPIVKASVLLLCPNGKTGQLADGDSSNNDRVLKDSTVIPGEDIEFEES